MNQSIYSKINIHANSYHDEQDSSSSMNLATFEACVKSMFFGEQQEHESSQQQHSNYAASSSSSNHHQLPSPNARIPRSVAAKKLRAFCVEANFRQLVNLFSDPHLVWKTEYSTMILTKTIRFIVASKVKLSVEVKNRVFDEFESIAGNNNDDFYGFLNKSNEDGFNHNNSSNSIVEHTDRDVINDISSVLFDVIFRAASIDENASSIFQDSWSSQQQQQQQQQPMIKTAKVNINQIASLAAFLFFCLYKDMTIINASQYRIPHARFHTDFPSISPYHHYHHEKEQNQRAGSSFVGTANDDRQNLLFRLIDELNLILSKTSSSSSTSSNNDNDDDYYYDDHDGLCISRIMNKYWFRALLKEIIIEFSDQPSTSPWDTFASRSHFLFPLLVFCERTVRYDFDVYFTVVARQMAIARDHNFGSSWSMDRENMADAEDTLARSCGIFSEFCNFIVKRTMFLPEVLGEESMRLPSFEWKCAFGSMMWFLRGISQAMFSLKNRDISNNGFMMYSHNNTVPLNHLHPRVCESLFSLLGLLSTISHDSFLYCADPSSLSSQQQQQQRQNSTAANNNNYHNNSFNPYILSDLMMMNINNNNNQSASDEYFNSIAAGVCLESNEEQGRDFGYNDFATFNMNDSFSPKFHYSSQRQHVIMMVQIASMLMDYAKECNSSSFGRGNNNNNNNNNNSSVLPPYFSLRIGSDAFEACGRILSNLAERFPETLTELMASAQLENVPSPDALDELAQFSVGAGKYSMMFSENSLRYFLTFSNCVIFQIGNFMKQHHQNHRNNNYYHHNDNNNNNNNNSSSYSPNDIERQNLDAIKSKLENLIVNSVSTLYEFIFSDTFTTNFSNNNNNNNSNGTNVDFQVSPESESEMMLSLVGSMLVRKTGDSFFLIRHLIGIFEQAVGCFFSVTNSSSPQAWNFENPQVGRNVYLVPFIIQTVAQSLQSCQESGLHLSQNTYTNSESILKELEEVYEERRNANNNNNNDDTCNNNKRSRHHPFINLLFLVCQFSEEIAAVAMKSLQDLLENLSINDDNNDDDENNNNNDNNSNTTHHHRHDDLFIDLIPSQFTPIFRALFYLFRTATRAGVMLRGPFSNAMVELCGFVLRSSASSALSLRNKLLYEDAVNLLSLLWGSGNEALQMTSHLQVSENLYSFHLEDRLYLTSSAAFSSSSSSLSTTTRAMMINDLLNHPSNFPTSTSYNKNSFFALRRKTLSLFYQRANIFAFEGNKIDCARVVNQMLFFTNVHSWGGQEIFRDDYYRDAAYDSIHQEYEDFIQTVNYYRCWLKDIKAAFCVGREVLHRRIFATVLQKGVLGFYEEEISDEEDERDGNNDDGARSTSFWGSVFSFHDKDCIPSLQKLANVAQHFAHRRDAPNDRVLASVRGLISDLAELCRQITQVAPITLGSVPPSSQSPIYFKFVSYFSIIAAQLIRFCNENFLNPTNDYNNNNGEDFMSFIINRTMDHDTQQPCDAFTKFSATPHLVINLAHTLWNLFSAKWINLGVLFTYDDFASGAFWSLISFVAKHGLAPDMKNMMSAKDALVVSNILVLRCCYPSSSSTMLSMLEMLLNPRAALEDASLVEEYNNKKDDDDDDAEEDYDELILPDDFDFRYLRGAARDRYWRKLMKINENKNDKNDKNDKPIIRLFDLDAVRRKNNRKQRPAVLIGKYGAGVTNSSNNERFFSLTKFFHVAAKQNDDEGDGGRNHLAQRHRTKFVAEAVASCLDGIRKQPDRTFYIRSLHCLLGTLDGDALISCLSQPASNSYENYQSLRSEHNMQRTDHHNNNNNNNTNNIFELRSIFAGILADSYIANRIVEKEDFPQFGMLLLSLLEDILLAIIPLLLSNQLSHLEDAATSAIAIVARLYDVCENNNKDNNYKETIGQRFRLCLQVLKDKYLCLDVHKQKLAEIMLTLGHALSFSDAVKKLSREFVQLQPSLLSIFASGDEHNIRARMSKKNVIPITPF